MSDPDTLLEPQIPALRRYAYALTRDRDSADDLVQDTLERALSRWTLRRADGEVRAWLFTILRNLYISGRRQHARRGPHVDLDSVSPPAESARQDAGIEMQELLIALEHLPEEQKSLLLLVGVEDLSYDEAARIMGVPLGTVMSRLSRGRQKLRSLMETGLQAGRTALLRRVK